MAEAILRHLSQGQVEAYSAGNEPSSIHPMAMQTMRARGIPTDGQRSKHLAEFAGQRFDYVVTVCDNARESCPVFPGDPERIHWSFEDPSAITDREARARAFSTIATELTTRINYLLLLISRQQRGNLKKPGE
jgi:protein-tyrosine-phosphatase